MNNVAPIPSNLPKEKTVLKLRQNAEAERIKELLCKISTHLPDVYAPADFKINQDYIEPQEQYSEVKIEIKNRYTISPVLIKKRSIGKHKIHLRGWLIEELIYIPSTREEPESYDSKEIATVSSFWDAAKTILLRDMEVFIDEILYCISESEAAAAATADLEVLKDAA